MKNPKTLVLILMIGFWVGLLSAQESRIVEIRQAGSFEKDEAQYPGANILLKKGDTRVHLFHKGALIKSNTSFFYSKRNFFEASGAVVFTQGDTLRMTSDYLEYDGKKGFAKAWGNVFLKQPDMTLETDTLYLDRVENIAYYETPGTIVDSSSVLKSNRGKYFMNEKKYRFISNVRIDNPEYKVTSAQLDYFTESNKAFLYGPTKIIGADYDIYCERGFYNMETQQGNFRQNALINYNEKIIEGDSLYFENEREYAAATDFVSITDTINNSIIRGNYAEIFKAKDSAIITRKAYAINILEKDSLFIKADTLVGTGPAEHRVLRGYYNVKILKSDIRGKSDSLYLDDKIGKIELHKRPLSKKEEQILSDDDKNSKNPVLWFGASQMSGEVIYLKTEKGEKKLDSLQIFGNAFIIEKDSLSSDGYNQIIGSELYGDFHDGALKNLDVVKNTMVIYYLYSDSGELIGINKTICSALDIVFDNNEINEISFYVSPDGEVFPEEKIDRNLRKLKGFLWRINERPETFEDLFGPEKTEIPEVTILKE
ncbi:OstA-like protein [Candidatus Arcticimaribacter forsetii]|uniref:OstA-like protein n=1 Tax=Candidatus Arcticimaribacter forsetii TaxID=2820661 RepID=UPI0020772C20|nr:OstA-like protein [Candidatus Arcticimaribacter forsetii]MDB4674920.1 OstA-like protein [Flavobacteriaceae bacterium]